jgi:AcrR family transcriptional regulator
MAYRATENTLAKKTAIRQRIVDEARAIVVSGGFSTVSMSVVAKRCGIAIGTIYRHFGSKAELLAQIFKYCTEHEVHMVARAAAEPGLVATRLQKACLVFGDRALHSQRLAYALIAEPVDPLVEQQRLIFRHAFGQIFEQLIIEGIASGELSALNPGISAAAIVGLLSEILVSPLTQLSTHSANDPEPLIHTPSGHFTVHEFITIASQLVCRLVGLEQVK